MIPGNGRDWLVTGSPVTTGALPGTHLRIFRWSGSSWHVQASLPDLETGGLNGPGSVAPASVTGSADPDFAVRSSGADTDWFALVSHIGGTWHPVPFDYGYGRRVAIDAEGVHGHLIETEQNSCGCATGPETFAWARYRDGVFQPTSHPGTAPPARPGC